VSAEDLERFETDLELALYKEYRDVLPMFRYVVEDRPALLPLQRLPPRSARERLGTPGSS